MHIIVKGDVMNKKSLYGPYKWVEKYRLADTSIVLTRRQVKKAFIVSAILTVVCVALASKLALYYDTLPDNFWLFVGTFHAGFFAILFAVITSACASALDDTE